MAERFDEEKAKSAIMSGLRRQTDCADPEFGESNRATYLLLDALRATGLVTEPNDILCFSRGERGKLVAFEPDRRVEGTSYKDFLRTIKMVADICDVQPALVLPVSGQKPEPFNIDRFVEKSYGIAGRSVLFLPKPQEPLPSYGWKQLD